MKEWPLVLFTVAMQAACGLTVACAVFDSRLPAAAERMRPLALSIFPMAAFGILVSLAHLGRPQKAWRAFLNLGRSRLSLEILLTALFALLAAAYSGFWWMGWTEGRVVLGAVAGAAGVAAVAAAAAVYAIPTQPAWNAGWVPASFLGTAALLGGLSPALFVAWNGEIGLLRAFLGAAAAGCALLLAALLWVAARFPRSLTPGKRLCLACHALLAVVLPAALILRLWPDPPRAPVAAAALAAVVTGIAMGRAAMYWPGVKSEPF